MDIVLPSKSQPGDPGGNQIEKFEQLLKIAIDLKLVRLKFYDCCKSWCHATENASNYITEIEKEIVKVNLTTNCISLGGVSTAIVGTAMGIAGVVLAPPTAGASLLLTVGGTSATALGGGLSIGSHVVKSHKSKSLCEKAKISLDETILLTEEVEKTRTAYFDTLADFKRSLEQLTEDELMATWFQLEEWCSSTELQFGETSERYLHPAVDKMMAMKPEDVISTEQRLAIIIHDIINAISEDPLAKMIVRLFEKSDIVQKLLPNLDFNAAIQSTEKSAKLVLQSSVAVYKLVKNSKVTMKNTLTSMSKTIRVGIGALNVLFLALGMVDLVTTSINIHNGSKSTESEQLSKIVEEMKEYREEVIRVLKDAFDWDFTNSES